MRISTLFGRTLREAPSEADQRGHQLALRAGLVRQVQAGSFALLPLGMRVLRRIEAIMHHELAAIGAQEFRTPIIQAQTAWEKSGRLDSYGPLMLRLADHSERPLIVAPTHEEAVADLAAREVASYRQMPQIVYQIHTKYRDETRAKGGLMRMREFTMLDAYSLDSSAAGLDASYELLAEAFERIFTRCGVRFGAVDADAGEMGGSEPREYMAHSESGEDVLAICTGCGYAANAEVAEADYTADAAQGDAAMEEIATPHTATIADLAALLGIAASATAKAVFFDTPERGLVFAVIRGDLEVNELKLRRAAGVSALRPASVEQIAAAGAVAGYASPVGLRVAGELGGAGVLVVADASVAGQAALVAGANRAGYHLRGVRYGRDWQATVVADIATVREGDACPRCGEPLACVRGVEIGHIFKLGTRFASALGALFLDADGAEKPIVMGSYGIGLERLMQIIIEQHNDERGIIWPHEVAPFQVHLVRLGKGEAARAEADSVYRELQAKGAQVLYDDRDESAGVKFNDADLIGIPLRVVVSERLLAAGQVEVKAREGAARTVARGDLYALL